MTTDLYNAALERLDEIDRRLAMAAGVVEVVHTNPGAVANRLLAYAEHRYRGTDILKAYAERAAALSKLQDRFDADPRPETLGDANAPVPRDVYNLSLLLSIAFTNHRFEIMRELESFFAACSTKPSGRIASIGTGTGYELERMAALLPGAWEIESYDIDESVQTEARGFLEYFGVKREVRWGREFPLDNPPEDFRGRYDAIVMCELLEHLTDPRRALASARECLKPEGRIFATMAINIAQEDHVYLYPDVASCRDQVREAGLEVLQEWITPQTTLPPPANREHGFKKGNYVAALAATT